MRGFPVLSIPDSWAKATIADVRRNESESVDPSKYLDETFELYSVPAHELGVPERVLGRDIGSVKKTVSPGTVVISKINPRINRVWVIPAAKGARQIASSEWITFFPIAGIVPTYLAHYLRQDRFRNYLSSNVVGVGGSLMRVNASVVEPYPLALPPTAEQQRIADELDSYVSRLDDAVATLERAQAKLKSYRASVLRAAVEGRLVPTEAELARSERRRYEAAEELLKRILKERRHRWEDVELAKLKAAGRTPEDDKWKARYPEPSPLDSTHLPELPEGWCWTTADQVGDILLGRQRSPDYLTGKWTRPYLRVANIKDDRIDFSDVEKMDFDESHFAKYCLKSGDILVSEGQSPHLVGQSAIFRGQIEGLCFQKTLHRFRAVAGGPRPEFAQIVFRANVMLGIYKALASITTNIAHLTLEKFRASRFPLPPSSEQDRIIAEVERLLSIANSFEETVRRDLLRMGRLRQAILKWAFEGRLVDQDPSDAPADGLLAHVRTARASVRPVNKSRSQKRKVTS